MSKEIYVCCVDCQLFKAEYVSFICTAWIEGERHSSHGYSGDATAEEIAEIKKEHEILHHEIMPPSQCCNTKIYMCQHKECFENVMVGLGMGTYNNRKR